MPEANPNPDAKPSFRHKAWHEPRWFFFFLLLFCILVGGLAGAYAEAHRRPSISSIVIGLSAALLFLLALAGLVLALIPPTRPWMVWALRRRFYILACIITAVVLLYTEENWRARTALDNYRREQEAKGEHFDFNDVVPPPVPDEQNLALAPIVMTTYEHVLDRSGRPLRTPNTNIVNRLRFELERATLNNNRVDEAPDLGAWQRGILTDLAAWQTYYRNPTNKDAKVQGGEFPTTAQAQTPALDILYALGKYDAAIEELRAEAARRPQARFPLEYDKDNPAAILLPHLAAIKGCIRGLELRALAELEADQSYKAFADVQLMFRMTESLRTEPTVISYLVRAAGDFLILQVVWEGISKHRWSDAQLAEIQSQLAGEDMLAGYAFGMRSERAFGFKCMEYMKGNRVEGQNMLNFDNNASSSADVPILIAPAAFFDFNALTIGQVHERYLLPAVDVEHQLVLPGHVRELQRGSERELKGFFYYHILARLLLPALEKLPLRAAHNQTTINLARTGCALERYWIKHGTYPDSLDGLAPQYIEALPHDVIDGKPLRYRREGDGYVLYSVGSNETDDGGKIGLKNPEKANKRPTINQEQGDWVWQVPGRME